MDFKEQITNSCVNGVCSRCGNCCTGFSIPLSMDEADAINSYVRRNGVKRLNRDWLSDKSCAVDIRCCFYDSVEKRCNIYEVRPMVCSGFQCDMSMGEIEKRKVDAHAQAFFNGDQGRSNPTSFDALFFGDFDFLPLALFIFLKKKVGHPCTLSDVLRFVQQTEFTYEDNEGSI